jgi:SAM-dependent methyltransferase
MGQPAEPLTFTGERVVPGRVGPDLYQEHLSRYAFAALLTHGLRALDAGCGTGYGTAVLAAAGARTVGVDVAPEAVRYARDHYGTDGVALAAAACEALPFPAGCFQAVVAFEIIEHLVDPLRFLREAARVLTPDGFLVASTPNRRFSADARAEPNPYHVREYSAAEFRDLLGAVFPGVVLLGQGHMEGYLVQRPGVPDDAPCLFRSSLAPDVGGGALEDAQFFLAVCPRAGPGPAIPPRVVYSAVRGNALLEVRAALEAVIQERERHLGAQAAHYEAVVRERERHLEVQAAHYEAALVERGRAAGVWQAEAERLRAALDRTWSRRLRRWVRRRIGRGP